MRAAKEGQDELRGDGGGAYEGGCGEEQRAHCFGMCLGEAH